MQIGIARGIALVGTIAVLGACGGGGDGGGGNNPVTTIIMATPSGNGQIDTIGAPLTDSLRVEVKEDGAVKQGVTVTWSAFTGGGSVAPASSVTGLDGVANTTWTLGPTLGAQSARATVAGASPVTFTATAGPGNLATTIIMATPSGNAQIDTIGAPLANPLRVEVKDNGAVKQGVTVNWSAFTGGGQVVPTSSVTGIDGVATTTWTLGNTLGAQSARATVAGAGGSPVTFTATAGPGNPNQITSNAGNTQSALLNASFATPVSVKVGDRLNNGINGVTVNWAVGSGPVAVDSATSSTNAQGIASMTATAGGTGGAGTVQASAGGVGGQVVFNLTVIAANRQVNVGAGTVFRSARNNTQNPAVDTVQANEAVYWLNAGSLHTVASVGMPLFTSSGNLSGAGASYTLTFANPGTYQYECAVHGPSMTGRIVVQ